MNTNDYGKILNPIFKNGYTPSREKSGYIGYMKSGVRISKCVNCFGHACFNLKNDDLTKLNLTQQQSLDIFHPLYKNDNDIVNAFDLIKSAGLLIENFPIKGMLKRNEWLVALYFNTDWLGNKDYHFLLQEKRGWSSKMGKDESVGFVSSQNPPDLFFGYTLFDTYKITNPYAESEST